METKEKLKKRILLPLVRLSRALCRSWDVVMVISLCLCLTAGILWGCLRHIPARELALRSRVVQTAQSWLGANEADGTHGAIIDLYNTQDPCPRDYEVTYEDNWCATFGSAVAMQCALTDIIPTECSCEQQIRLFDDLGAWQEDECYLPRPGDYIYYVWDEWRSGDCTAWADHVGIVAETFGPVIKVIEGNKDNCVSYRYIFLNDICIRGFGLPDYGAKCK